MNGDVKDQKELVGRFYFDTGAGMCLLLSSDFVSDSVFINPKRKCMPHRQKGWEARPL